MSIPPPVPKPPRSARATVVLGVIGALVIGVFIALQSRINGGLGAALADGYVAAIISFGSGLVILSIALIFWKPGRRGVVTVVKAIHERETPWWYICAGANGAIFVLAQGLTGAVLGVALFTVATVAGQTVSAMIVDRRGIGRTPGVNLTVSRAVGAVIALLAVGWAVSPHVSGDVPYWMLVLPLVAGFGLGVQQALNGQVRLIANSALTPTFFNFLAGSVVLVVVNAIHLLIVGWPEHFPTNPLLYLGGLVGTIFIAGSAIVVRMTGLLLLGLGTTAGQLATALVLDVVLPIPGHVIVFATVAGTLLTIVAVFVAAIPSRQLRRGTR